MARINWSACILGGRGEGNCFAIIFHSDGGKGFFSFFFTNKIFTRSIRSTRNVIWGGITIQFLKFDPFDEDRGGYFPILEAGRTYIMQSYVNNAGFARGGGRGGGRNRWTIFPRVLKSQVLRARLLHPRSNVTYELFNALSIN